MNRSKNNNMSYHHAYWPIALFWKTFGVFPANVHDDGRNVSASPLLFTALLAVSCAYALFAVPSVVCRIGEKCTSESIKTLKEIYPGVANVTSALSRIALSYSVKVGFDKYRQTIQCYETYAPTTAAEAARRRMFAAAAVCTCLVLVVPVNVLRLRVLWTDTPDDDGGTGIFLYAFVYVQNVTMCCSETQFADQCFALYCKLKTVNEDVTRLGGPAGLARFSAPADPEDRGAAAVEAAADAVETLRIRHWLLREAVACLNQLFGVQLGMSVCALCVMSFFDIYYETFHVMGEYSMSDIIIYSWMLHYSVRYVGIILLSHHTTKQALYTKTLIANLKSNYLDCNINKELHLFLDQLSYSSVEFTACDIFTLNIRLIISTFAAGLTYLVILIQYQTNKKL